MERKVWVRKHTGIWICWSGEVLGGVEHSRGSRKRQQGVDVGHEAGDGGFLFVQRTICRTVGANLAVGDLGVHSGSPRLMQKDGASRFCSDSPLGPKNSQASRLWIPARSLPLMQHVAIQTLSRQRRTTLNHLYGQFFATGVELVPLILLDEFVGSLTPVSATFKRALATQATFRRALAGRGKLTS